jgi:hypothetical protein
MAQVSRPFQIALGAVVVLALVWMVTLRSHLSKPSEPAPSSPSVSAPAPNAASEAKAAAAATPVYHGAAPGVEGLTRAIAKAHEAVASSQKNAQQLQNKSAAASGDRSAIGQQASSSAAPNAVAARSARGVATTQRAAAAATLAHKTAARGHGRSGRSSKAHGTRSAAQVAVEREIAHGKTVMLVFWNPKSTVDQEVRAQAGALVGGSKGTVTLHTALARQVGMFAPITEVAHVYQTPTILIINRHGLVSTLTGLTDVFALQQAVREARRANR